MGQPVTHPAPAKVHMFYEQMEVFAVEEGKSEEANMPNGTPWPDWLEQMKSAWHWLAGGLSCFRNLGQHVTFGKTTTLLSHQTATFPEWNETACLFSKFKGTKAKVSMHKCCSFSKKEDCKWNQPSSWKFCMGRNWTIEQKRAWVLQWDEKCL